jgi:NodT family efflux transporter outer membrane factor (OMF) lipoprotein
MCNIRDKFMKYFVLLFCAMLAGCMVGPDYERPETVVDSDGGYVNMPEGWSDPNEMDAVGQWWKNFGDKTTDDLVQLALEHNNNLKAARAQLLQGQAFLARSKGARLPQLSYGFNRGDGKTSFNLPAGRVGFPFTSYSQDLNISYMVDFFGMLKRSEQAAFADVLATEASLQALKHAIIAQVVRSRVEIATQQRLLESTRDNIKSRNKTYKIVESRYQSGLVSPLDIYLAKENLAAAKAAEPQLELGLILAQNGLDVLTGQRPASTEILEGSLPDLPKLTPVPTGMPAALLDRRPDVKAAEMKLRAATERVGVSIAAMYPDLTLSASGGYRSDTYRMLTATEGQVYQTVLAVAAPIFKGGQLKAQVDAAKAKVQQTAAEYAQVILVAIREVEDAMVTERLLFKRVKLLQERLEDAKRAESLAKERYSRGVEKVLIVLDTERRRRLAEDELTVTAGRLFNARIDMFLALGGDWKIDGEDEMVQ